ncbi:MAG: nitroreductase family protein [Bacteroidales bacterium]|nr:nitroreductase family protein [Bacteroidales bacterium]
MDFSELVAKCRSYRRFNESVRIEYDFLKKLIGYARLSPSASNKQPLKFLLYNSPSDCDKIFPCTNWAGYLSDWHGPEPGERPTAYIIILGDTKISDFFGIDPGIAAQSIKLGATEAGFGGCMIASIEKKQLRSELQIPEQYEILLIIALGKPVEKVVIEDIKNNDVKYWRDENEIHHVPKRTIDELILKL